MSRVPLISTGRCLLSVALCFHLQCTKCTASVCTCLLISKLRGTRVFILLTCAELYDNTFGFTGQVRLCTPGGGWLGGNSGEYEQLDHWLIDWLIDWWMQRTAEIMMKNIYAGKQSQQTHTRMQECARAHTYIYKWLSVCKFLYLYWEKQPPVYPKKKKKKGDVLLKMFKKF